MSDFNKINLELVKDTKPIDVFNQFKNFNYSILGDINDCIVNGFKKTHMEGLWMFNNHNQPLCISPSWTIYGEIDRTVKIDVKMFRDDSFNVFVYLKDSTGVRDTICQGYSVNSPIKVIGLILMHSKTIYDFLGRKLFP